MNAVRKRFTRWGAGRLALALAPARTHALIISDVEGDDPADIGSGPCTPDAYTAQRRDRSAPARRACYDRIAAPMRDYLAGVVRGVTPETPKRTHPAFAHVATRVIGSNRLSTQAAARARAVARHRRRRQRQRPRRRRRALRRRARRRRCSSARATAGAAASIWGGETTVQLERAHDAGRTASRQRAASPRGGRCQELALAAARVLAEGGDAARRITLLAAGTDGRDGPTDAAGAFADATIWEAIRASGRDPELALARHDSYAVLDAVGALHPTRPHGNERERRRDWLWSSSAGGTRLPRGASFPPDPVATSSLMTTRPFTVGIIQDSASRRRGRRRSRPASRACAKPPRAARRSSASRSSSTRRTSASRRSASASTSPSRSRARRPTSCRSSRRSSSVVLIVPIFEKQARGVYRNSAAIIDADGSLLGVYRKMHIPDDPLFNEKYYFVPGDAAHDDRIDRSARSRSRRAASASGARATRTSAC